MDSHTSIELMRKYSNCPDCGSARIGNGDGTMEVGNNMFRRTCNCGFSLTIETRIKIIATATKRVGRKTEGIYEVSIDGLPRHKYLPANELKELAGLKRINQHAKAEEWLNTTQGRKWALETPHTPF